MNDSCFLSLCYWYSADGVSRWMCEEIGALPAQIRPTHYGEAERGRRRDNNRLSDHDRFDAFREQHRGGFFLYGEHLTILMNLYSGLPSDLSVYTDLVSTFREGRSLALWSSFGRTGAVYGFAGDWAEYAARNQYTIYYVDGGRAEGFIGRDFTRYVPGLYWQTYFSDEYGRKMKLDLARIAEEVRGTIIPVPGGSVLQLYEDPADWPRRRQEVGDWLHQAEGFFSIRRVDLPTDLSKKEMFSPRGSPDREWP